MGTRSATVAGNAQGHLVIFTDPAQAAARILAPAALACAALTPELSGVTLALPPAAPAGMTRLRWHGARLRRRLQSALGCGRWDDALDVAPADLVGQARRLGTKTLVLPGGDPNHPEVLRYLSGLPQPVLGLNLYCIRPFQAALLARLAAAANYHNGALPRYRGLRASNWSLYMGDSDSGFCFHRMTGEIDAGAILSEGRVPLSPSCTAADLEVAKASTARTALPGVIAALQESAAGRPQAGVACLHTRSAHELATHVAEPSRLGSDEWERRLRAFLRIHTRLDGRWWPVTALAPGKPGDRLSFVTSDGRRLTVAALDFWPAALVRATCYLFPRSRDGN